MNIGFVGVGRMGANMARRLKDRQFHITGVYDTNRAAATALAAELGCAASQDLSEVTAESDVIFTVVTDDAASPDTPEVAGAAGSNTLTAWKPAKLSQTAELTLAPDAHAIVNVAPSVPSATRKNNWYWVLLITVAVTAVNPAGVFSAIAPRRTIHSRMTSPGAVFGGLAMV